MVYSTKFICVTKHVFKVLTLTFAYFTSVKYYMYVKLLQIVLKCHFVRKNVLHKI